MPLKSQISAETVFAMLTVAAKAGGKSTPERQRGE
jgi:hypothetical protein